MSFMISIVITSRVTVTFADEEKILQRVLSIRFELLALHSQRRRKGD